MKSTFYLGLLFFLFISVPASASHIIGLQITYEYTGTGSDYIFRAKLYRDCAGISAPIGIQLRFSSASCGLSFVSSIPLVSSVQVPMSSCAGFAPSTCQGGTIIGLEEKIYEGLVSVPACSDWIVSSNICCRNFDVTNITNAPTYTTYVETRFDNLNFPGNSSPQFSYTPANYYCAGLPSLKDYGSFDPDGDSVRYELVAVLNDSITVIPFASGYSAAQPLATLTGCTLDSLTGMLLFTPSQIQVSVLGVLISEFRNGTLIGTVRVDDEIIVGSGIANPDTVSGRVYIDQNTNGVFDGNDVPMQNTTVQMNPGNIVTSTAFNGKYDLYTVDGNYTVSLPVLPSYYTVAPPSISVNTNGITFSGGNDFILTPLQNINDLQIHLNGAGNPVPGQPFQLFANYQNAGTTIQSGVEVTVTLDPMLQYVNASPLPANIAGSTLTWTFPSFPVFMSGIIHINTSVDTTAVMGSSVLCTASITSSVTDVTPANNADTVVKTVSAAYDPNYKEVFPSGDLPLAFVASQDWLNYTIHFQNLGTAPAQLVRIADLMDPDLELSSLEFVASSFPCSYTISSPGQVEFRFSGINLPPASVDEPGSHGFVEFRIRPRATLQPGTYITNRAGIYFDFAAPVYTNMVHNKVVNVTTGLNAPADLKNVWSLYPNPAVDQCVLEYSSIHPEKVQVSVYNLLGSAVRQFTAELTEGVNRIGFSIEDLPAGNYIIRVADPLQTHHLKLNVVR